MNPGPQIPGFTPDQTWALKRVIRDAVREANDHDERVAKLESCVFGDGKDGLKDTLVEVKSEVESMVWWYHALAVGVISSWLTALVALIVTI